MKNECILTALKQELNGSNIGPCLGRLAVALSIVVDKLELL